MTREEAEEYEYTNEMTYRDAVYNTLRGKCIPHRKETISKLYELLEAFEQAPKCNYCPNCGAKLRRKDGSEVED